MLSILSPGILRGQVELVPVDHKVYPFLESLSTRGLIDYDEGNIPISRGEVASYLKKLEQMRVKLTPTENKILDDLEVEFSYDIHKSANKLFPLFSYYDLGNIFNGQQISGDRRARTAGAAYVPVLAETTKFIGAILTKPL